MEVPAEIMAKYIENRKHDLDGCLVFYRQQNFDKIAKVGHQLKGNGSTFGHPELSTIGRNLEEAAKDQDSDLLNAALKDFSHWLKKVS